MKCCPYGGGREVPCLPKTAVRQGVPSGPPGIEASEKSGAFFVFKMFGLDQNRILVTHERRHSLRSTFVHNFILVF